MLRLDKLAVVLGDFRLQADWHMAEGGRLALLGASGSGKSTLLAAMAGFVPLQAGQITWQGRVLDALAPGARPVSLLFQDHNLFAHLDVAQNIGLGLSPDLALTAADRDRVRAVLAEVGLDGFGARKPAQLSGGQASRVALARALVRDRPLWLLDEPFAALGPGLRHEMLDLLDRTATKAGASVILVTHDPDDARCFARQTVFIDAGVAHPPVDTADLLNDPPPALAAYLGA